MRKVDFKNETEFGIVKSYIDIMARKPYDKIRIKEIVDGCGIARSTFYLYFEDSLDLLDKLERTLLEQLVLYPSQSSQNSRLKGMPFECMEQWFMAGVEWRRTLRTLFSENGDPYFLRRLQNQIRANLNDMMDYDGAPNDESRPYYVELLTASYVGMLMYVVSEESEKSLISVHKMAEIANSTRTAFFRTDDGAPHISDEQLFGRSDESQD